MSKILAEDTLYQQLVSGFLESDLDERRRLAFDRFRREGFPTVKNEEWKYTNLHRLVNRPYARIDPPTARLAAPDIAKADIPELDAHRIVVANGHYLPELSDPADGNDLTVRSIREARDEPNFQKHYACHADRSDSVLVQLNTAADAPGLYIAVAAGTAVAKPLHIVHLAAGDDPFFAQTRSLIVAERSAEVEIIESFVTLDGTAHNLHNNVSEIVLEEGAKVRHYQLQTAGETGNYLNHTEVHQEGHSLYNNYNCNLPGGAAFVRNNINVCLAAENVESHLYGINLTAGTQFVDNHTVVDHLMPNCESYEWYKNIPRDESTAVFNGKIFVRQDAQKTNAFQQNNNMLIGERATVHSKPQLEIFADDVKCSHGCTMGQFDEEALFYLRSRGIGGESARVLLVHAFAFDVVSRFSNEAVRAYVEDLVGKGLG